MEKRAPSDAMGLVDLYFPGGPTAEILSMMRPSLFLGAKTDIPYSLTIQSQDEIEEMRGRIDEVTPEFAQNLNALVLAPKRNVKVRAFMLITADYLNSKDEVIAENAIIAKNLGTNPWPLYQGRGGYDSIDTRLTDGQTKGWIDEHQAGLKGLGIKKIRVGSSGFYYVREADLEENGFLDHGEVGLSRLVTFLTDTYGTVGLEQGVQKPSEKEYLAAAVPFLSYRQKQTLADKIERKLCQGKPYENAGDVVSDWGAHRIAVPTEEEARKWGMYFQGDINLARFGVDVAWRDDYYTEPKKNGFKSFNLAVEVKRKAESKSGLARSRFKPTVRELQIYDLRQHYDSQINEESPAHHRRFRDTQNDSMRKRRGLMRQYEYDEILKLMFNIKEMVLLAPQAH